MHELHAVRAAHEPADVTRLAASIPGDVSEAMREAFWQAELLERQWRVALWRGEHAGARRNADARDSTAARPVRRNSIA